MIDLVWWVALVALLSLSLTQWLGFDGSMPVAILQSLSLPALACSLPLGVAATLTGRWPIALLCLLPLATLVWLAAPIRRARTTTAGEQPFTLAFGNLLAKNTRVDDAMADLAATGADLLVLVEFTPTMEASLDRLVGAHYPHRIGEVRPDPAGIAVWSRVPMTGAAVRIVDRPSVDVRVRLGDDEIRVLAVHTTPPTLDARIWRDEIRAIADAAEGTGPTVLVGDFNAARWHPTFRELLARGWCSGHEMVGHGWSVSWPMRGYPAPPFVRIDHALVRHGASPLEVREIGIRGSDHRGFVMTLGVSPATATR